MAYTTKKFEEQRRISTKNWEQFQNVVKNTGDELRNGNLCTLNINLQQKIFSCVSRA